LRIALVGDLHHYRIHCSPRQLLGKRLIGQTNLWLNRQFAFKHALLKPTLERVPLIKPDRILLTGDVTTTSLDHEFLDVVRLLRPLSDNFDVKLVPGNHDRYTFASARQQRVEALMEHLLPPEFPHFEQLSDHWHFLALDAARPRLMLSCGRLGRHQLDRTRDYLASLTSDDGLLVLCHYPLSTPANVRPMAFNNRVSDGRALRRMLAQCPARVVFLHGHIHRPWIYEPRSGDMKGVTFINAGAPCLTNARYPGGQGFWQLDLPRYGRGDLRLTHHVPVPADPDAGRRLLLRQPRPDQLVWERRRVRRPAPQSPTATSSPRGGQRILARV